METANSYLIHEAAKERDEAPGRSCNRTGGRDLLELGIFNMIAVFSSIEAPYSDLDDANAEVDVDVLTFLLVLRRRRIRGRSLRWLAR